MGAGFFATNQGRGGSNEQVAMLVGLGFAYFLTWAIGWTWTVHNSLIDLRNRVRRAWSQVDVQLKRRHDLIPQVLKMVQALKNHEKKVHEQIAQIRSQQSATAPDDVGDDFQSVRSSLLAIQENYPELKTSEAYSGLHRQLVETENRIALAKDYFNTITTHYNTRIEQLPDCHVCSLSGLQPRRLILAEAFERAAIDVEFAD
ncbi:MAG: LemA family protein [Limisphaerales bacterium]